jgi:3-isopropylmalate/(R)-2-methylmalate dehydratase large subunit
LLPENSHTIELTGRVLWLTEDPDLLARQVFDGLNLPFDRDRPLLAEVSTDEIIPASACVYYDQTLGEYVFTGLRGARIGRGDILRAGFCAVVSGHRKGAGSSRETAPLAEQHAGIRMVFARSIERIYRQNCENTGLLCATRFDLLERAMRGEVLTLDDFASDLRGLSAEIVRGGGLLQSADRSSKKVYFCETTSRSGGLTAVEKIVTAHAADPTQIVRAGDSLFVRPDVRFLHDYVTPMVASILASTAPDRPIVRDGVYFFRDHLVLFDQANHDPTLQRHARSLITEQDDFAQMHDLPVISGSICHSYLFEQVLLPGQIVVGTDSHTTTGGAAGCLAFGIGATDAAAALTSGLVRMTVPETIRIVLENELSDDACAKDLMLHLLLHPALCAVDSIGKVLEFCGPGLASIDVRDRPTLTNMAVELGAFSGIIDLDEPLIEHLMQSRRVSREQVLRQAQSSDADARYCRQIKVDLSTIEPMIATPGSPRNGVTLREMGSPRAEVPIDIAYGGSCTGGKISDIERMADVFFVAQSRGLRVHPRVRCYVQPGSWAVQKEAEKLGYLQLFESLGAHVITAACGACIGAGPGVSRSPSEVTVSSQNRNFPGRSGPGFVYLASPRVVAASAILGFLGSPRQF